MKLRVIVFVLMILVGLQFLLPKHKTPEERRVMVTSLLGINDVPAVKVDAESTTIATVTATTSQ